MANNPTTATITFHASNNNGAFLQAYALQYYITNILCLPNDIIDFQSEQQKEEYSIFGSKKGIVGLFRNLSNLMHYFDLASQKKKYETLRKKYLTCTQECAEINDVLRKALRYDILICGSDQIWNADLKDFSPAFYLPGLRNKISYAASLGKDICDTTRSYLEKYLPEFETVSVREESAAKLLRDDFSIRASCCTDPTLLVDRKVYEKIINDEHISVPENYIFLYTVKFQNYILEMAEQLSDIYGLPVYTIQSTSSAHAGLRAEKHHIHVLYSGGPADFLTYVKNASLVISDSFHGIVFSVIFHKCFFRGQLMKNGTPVKDERLDSFLSQIGLSDRVLLSNQEDVPCSKDINWKSVDENLCTLVEKSQEWLEHAITSLTQKRISTHLPHLFEDIHHCCGCGACYASCPTGSIIMLPDEEGFEYPHINPHTCIGCNKCVDVCSFKADQKLKGNS